MVLQQLDNCIYQCVSSCHSCALIKTGTLTLKWDTFCCFGQVHYIMTLKQVQQNSTTHNSKHRGKLQEMLCLQQFRTQIFFLTIRHVARYRRMMTVWAKFSVVTF